MAILNYFTSLLLAANAIRFSPFTLLITAKTYQKVKFKRNSNDKSKQIVGFNGSNGMIVTFAT